MIIDTTAEPTVVETLAHHTWDAPKAFVSASLSYAARRLYFYRHEGHSFDADGFERATGPWIRRDRDAAFELPMEGIGCWHPVFPARADGIWLLAATAVQALEAEHTRRPWTEPRLVVFARTERPDGLRGVEVAGEP